MISANPSLTANQIQDIIKQSADDLGPAGWDPQYGWGRVNAYRAVYLAKNGVLPPPIDTQAPSAPSNLQASADSTRVNLTWLPSTDNVGVTGYRIYRNNTLFNTTTLTSFTDTTVVSGTGYSYYVIATDANSNLSPQSNLVSIVVPTTPPPSDTTAPTVSITSPTTGTTYTSAQAVTISATASDNVGVTRVEFYKNSTLFSTDTTSPWSTTWNLTSADNGTHSFIAKAYDAASNNQTSQAVSLTVNIPVPDTEAPSAPSNLQATADSTRVNLTWLPSTDNVGVTGYKLYRNGALLTSLSTTNYTDTTVSSGSSYSYYVVATDLAGNFSTQSNTVSVSVPTPPIVAPVITSYSVTKKTMTTATITWTTDIPTTGNINYGLTTTNLSNNLIDSTLNTSHTLTLTNLTKSTKYYYKITATGNNTNTNTAVSTFRTMGR
jgi:chitinase